MNYYERHLGDYAKDTGHLSMLEHGAYTMLMDRYYSTEQPIPAEQAHRLARAKTEDERAAVDVVLQEFFVLENGAWKKGRIEEELSKAKARVNAARENGKRGGRPPNNPPITQPVTSGLDLGTPAETQIKALHLPSSHLPSTKRDREANASPRATRKCPDSFLVTNDLLDWAALDAPMADVQRETDKFRDYTFKTSRSDWPATWKNWMRKASDDAKSKPTGEPAYAKFMREKYEKATPLIAAKKPGTPNRNPMDILDELVSIDSRSDLLEMQSPVRPGLPGPVGGAGHR